MRAAVAITALGLVGGAAAADDAAYVGGYAHNSVDTASQLVILDDHSFCYAFVGGSLDKLIAGRWKSSSSGQSIRLQQVRPSGPLFPAWGQQDSARTGDGLVFEFHGYSLAEAKAPVFAVAPQGDRPKRLRPLFVADRSSGKDYYSLPMPRAKLRDFYIGDVELDARGQPSRLRVTQYRLPKGNRIRLAFDTEQVEPPLDLRARLVGEVLEVNGERFGQREALEADEIQVARERCIAPVLSGATGKKPQAEAHEDADDEDVWGRDKELLRPVRTFYLKPDAIQGEPWFPAS